MPDAVLVGSIKLYEIIERCTRADILTCGQFKGMAFEFGGVGLSGGHGLASYGEA